MQQKNEASEIIAIKRGVGLAEGEVVVGNFFDYMNLLADALCAVLTFAPGGEVNFSHPAPTCVLKFTVSKE